MKRKATNPTKGPNGMHTCHYLCVKCLFLLISSITLAATSLTVKRAKVIQDNSKGSNSALSSSLQGQAGVSIPPSDLRIGDQEDEEDGQEDSIEASDKDEDGMKVKIKSFCVWYTMAEGCSNTPE